MAPQKFSKNLFQLLMGCAGLLALSMAVSAQTGLHKGSGKIFAEASILMDKNDRAPVEIKFPAGKGLPASSFFENYKAAFGLSQENEIKPLRVFTDKLGQTHHRYTQLYKGIELAEVQFLMHEKDGAVFYAQGPLIHELNLSVQPKLSEPEALQRALAHVNAASYMWQNKAEESHLRRERLDQRATYYPQGELRISAGPRERRAENFHLVYRFDIYAEKPLGRYDVDVDAQTGEIVNVLPRMYSGDVHGVGMSVYNGVVPIVVNDSLTSTTGGPARWHTDSFNAHNGSGQSWWAADPTLGNQGGYENHWYEVLDTNPIVLSGANPSLSFYHRYAVETPGGEPAGYDGWDGMNVRISTATDTTWRLLTNPTPAYTNNSLYSFGSEFGEGTGVPGWCGRRDTWTQVTFNLSAYAGKTIRLRFAFASDPGFSTTDGGPELYGWQIDDITVSSATGVLFSNDGISAGMHATNIVTEVSFVPGKYRLREAGRGKGISTYDARNGTVFGSAIDYVDADSNFTAPRAAAGVSTHWALEATYDYYLTKHSRHSYDDADGRILAYTHFDNNWFNAQWDGAQMRFGDGNNNSTPLVGIDVVGHEFTHGVTQYTANLIYAGESGALNESFSDIFGTAVEFSTPGVTGDWRIGQGATALRSMSDPKSFGQPDTYRKSFWVDPNSSADNGGVHTNSGVQNHWFYLLAEGGNGVNDDGYFYNVTGIGMEQAAQIAYRNLSAYLMPTSDYPSARLGSLQSATDLFGSNSPQFQATVEAWNAVGVTRPSFSPTLNSSADSLRFLAEAAVASDTAQVTLTNYGLEDLQITAIQIAGASFRIISTTNLPVALQYDNDLTIQIVFTPAVESEFSGTLTVSSNDPAHPATEIALQGTGFTIHPTAAATIYGVGGRSAGGALMTIDSQSGSSSIVGASGFEELTGVSIRPSNGELYATAAGNATTSLLRIDSQSGRAFEVVKVTVPQLRALAFDQNDNLYAARFTNGELYRIDLATGETEFIGATRVSLLSGLAINPVDGTLWGATVSPNIYRIDKTTAQSTLVGNTGFNPTPAIVFDAAGKLLALTGFTTSTVNQLVQINPATAKGTVIGSTGQRTVFGLTIRGTAATGVADREESMLPARYALHPNFPNPFNPTTEITFELPVSGEVSLTIYSSTGQLVRQLVAAKMEAGSHTVTWDAKDGRGMVVASGVYVYLLKSRDFVAQRKLVLMK